MKRLLLFVLAAAALSACMGTGVRYSPTELAGFPPKVQEHIRNGEATLDMSPLAVRYAWGSPDAINVLSPDDAGRSREEWVYTKLRVYDTRLIFTDGKLTHVLSGLTQPGIVQEMKNRKVAPATPTAPATPEPAKTEGEKKPQ